MANNSDLYKKIVKISEEFLGPAGERFIRRQVETHLSIRPEDIKPQHLPELVEWTRLMFAVITDDSKIIDDFTNRLLGLANNRPTTSVSSLRS